MPLGGLLRQLFTTRTAAAVLKADTPSLADTEKEASALADHDVTLDPAQANALNILLRQPETPADNPPNMR